MLRIFRPEFSGTFSPERLRADFIKALAERVRSGLFPRSTERRNRYTVVSESEGELRFRSEGFLSATNIGWNDVRVQIDMTPEVPSAPPEIKYQVTYFGWARYSVLLCGLVAVCLIVAWSLFRAKYETRHDVAKVVFWIMVIFWGFIWPWILVLIHKGPAARALERLFAEVDSGGE